ncbi:MAG: ABC transporter permease [Bacteroidota bacterium]
MAVKTTFRENVAIALQSIGGNRLRTSLTALIIAIGITALVGILTAIEGLKQRTNDVFSQMGANSFTVRNRGTGIKFGGGRAKVYTPIKYEQAVRFKQRLKIPAVVSVTTYASNLATVKYGDFKTNPNISIIGGDENYLKTAGYTLAAGRNFSPSELEHASNVIIIGDDIKNRLFKTGDPINKMILVGSNKFKVIGLTQTKGSSAGFNGGDQQCVIPLYRAKQISTNPNGSYTITVMVDTPAEEDAATGEATSLFRNIRGLRMGQDNNFEISRSDAIKEQLATQLNGIQAAGFGIGIITLIGAAIGLMNIMLVSVTERTREIGVRKAIGATPAIIRKQFLIEAIVICLIGGVGGIILGMAAGNLIAVNISGTFIIPWVWLFCAIVLCTGIGLASGFYPAKKASKLDPVEALRYE